MVELNLDMSQGRIQDFWKGVSNLERGFKFRNGVRFAIFFISFILLFF